MTLSARDRIRARLEELQIDPKKSLGQNFLVNDAVIGKIIKAAERLKPQRIVEVGPGLGSLTSNLIEFKTHLQLIELDRNMSQYWRDQGAEVFEADALQLDWKNLELPKDWILVSNLPYQISSSLVIERTLEPLECKAMVLMFQKEVAQRIMAKHRTPDYGFLSAAVQPFWLVEKVCDASPQDFWPPPKVSSRVLQFTARPSQVNRRDYISMVKRGFAFRRKFLIKSLSDWANQKQIPPEALSGFLNTAKIGEKARAEEVSVAQWLQLYDCWKQWESR